MQFLNQTYITLNFRPHGLCRAKRLSIVLREGAVRSLVEKTCAKTNKNSWGEIRTLDLTGMSRALSPTELPSQVYSKIIQLSTGSVASSAALTNYKTCSLRSRELPSQVFLSLFNCQPAQLLRAPLSQIMKSVRFAHGNYPAKYLVIAP